MAVKGKKVGTGKPAAPKPAARAKAAPKAKVAAVAAEKPAPVVEPEPVAPVAVAEPDPVVEAAPQEVEVAIEAVEPEVAEAVETVEAEAEPVAEMIETTPAPEVEVEAPAAEAVEPVIEPALETVIEAVAAPVAPASIKENNVMDTIETNMAKAQAFFTDFNDRAKVAVEKSTKIVEEANEFAKGNLEAIVESGKITAKGLEAFGQDAAEYGRKSFESATSALKGLATVKSPTEFFKLQSDFFRTSFDSAVAEASKSTEALIKLASDAAQPLSNRVAVAVEKAKVAA